VQAASSATPTISINRGEWCASGLALILDVNRQFVVLGRVYDDRCVAPAAIAAAQFSQQKIWPARSTMVVSSTIVDSQWAQRGRPVPSIVRPLAIATQFLQQYVLPPDSCIVSRCVIAVPQCAQLA
jgi:hypothetical protein